MFINEKTVGWYFISTKKFEISYKKKCSMIKADKKANVLRDW